MRPFEILLFLNKKFHNLFKDNIKLYQKSELWKKKSICLKSKEEVEKYINLGLVYTLFYFEISLRISSKLLE